MWDKNSHGHCLGGSTKAVRKGEEKCFDLPFPEPL